jgi:methionyl-tRNA formyltransferase
MKIIFISGVKFGYDVLNHILNHNWKVEAVFSYHESKKEIYSDMIDFDSLTSKFNIKNFKVNNINDEINVKLINDISPDLILVIGWSQLLKNNVLKIPKIGIIGSHPTELPKFRGRAPIPWSIIKNLKESALTLFWIQEGTDNGPILDQQKFIISDNDDASTLYEKMTSIGKTMILDNIYEIKKGKITKILQDESKFIESWPKRTSNDGKIDWNHTAKEIHTLIRASTHPYPGAYTYFKKKKLVIWKSVLVDSSTNKPGELMKISDSELQIGTSKGIIKLIYGTYDDLEIKNFKTFFSEKNLGDILE